MDKAIHNTNFLSISESDTEIKVKAEDDEILIQLDSKAAMLSGDDWILCLNAQYIRLSLAQANELSEALNLVRKAVEA